MNSVMLEEITFKEIERSFFEIGCEVAKMLMKQFLENIDQELAEHRDKSELRHKGNRTRTIKTLMGEVSLKRSIYKRTKDDGSSEHVYLLDEALGFKSIGFLSPNLAEKILEHSCEMSYREVSRSVSNLTNQSISHQGVWNIIQSVGEKQEEVEADLVRALKNQELAGKKEVPVLFEEADGLWLALQGKSREKAPHGRKELKISVVYEGWKPRYSLSKEYETVDKMAFAGYHKAKEMKELRDAAIANKYNVDEILYRILNGDGAPWIKNGHDAKADIFQLDPYHLGQGIIRNVADKRTAKQLLRWFKAGEHSKALKRIEELKYASGGEVAEIAKLNTLESYIRNNLEGLIPYKERQGVKLPQPPQGLEYRNLGTMERQVEVFAVRMKGAKSWSESGATHLAKIIALKMSKGFKEQIATLVSGRLPERVTERFEETITNTRQGLNKAVKKSVYPLHRGEIPYTHSSVTNGRKVIRSLFDLKTFSEMVYR